MRFTDEGRGMDLDFILRDFDDYFIRRKPTSEEKMFYNFFKAEVVPTEANLDGNYYGDKPTIDFIEGIWGENDPEQVRIRLGKGREGMTLQLICISGLEAELFVYNTQAVGCEPSMDVKTDFLEKVKKYGDKP